MDLTPPSSTLVPVLLLLAAPPPGGCCSFDSSPVSSTFGTHVDALTPWLLLDYPVPMPVNLEVDSPCTHLWGLHFGAAALEHMVGAAGGALAPRLRAVAAHIAFVAECHIHDPQGCVRLETVNVSQLLGALVQHLGGLRGRPLHFPGCARLRCRPGTARTPPGNPNPLGDPPKVPSDPRLSPGPPLTPRPAVQHERILGSQLGPPSPGIHGLMLLGGLGGALGLAAAAWVLWRRPCAQPSQGTPESEQDGT
ncbi:fms-related tyrosine kinase 3 ligand [Athene noctua]|uniref:fms-related tyrosine kinase 3 ligand n=1 Tax=Athene noctua TaxID=126797 RepID=UPI003EB95618